MPKVVAKQASASQPSRSSTLSTSFDASDKHGKADSQKQNSKTQDPQKGTQSKTSDGGEFFEDEPNQQPAVDFVLYLQQTGSIIALAKLMDALEYGDDYDEKLDDAELKMIREQFATTGQ